MVGWANGQLTEYQSNPDSAFDPNRLYGSKMLMGNVELRFPLLGVLGIGKSYFGAWPIEFFGFFDWGIAFAQNPGYWWGGETPEDVKPTFFGGKRKPISSAGIGVRTNLFGYLVLGWNYVYPFDRRERGSTDRGSPPLRFRRKVPSRPGGSKEIPK